MSAFYSTKNEDEGRGDASTFCLLSKENNSLIEYIANCTTVNKVQLSLREAPSWGNQMWYWYDNSKIMNTNIKVIPASYVLPLTYTFPSKTCLI